MFDTGTISHGLFTTKIKYNEIIKCREKCNIFWTAVRLQTNYRRPLVLITLIMTFSKD